jgi:hypothetical protein
MSRFTTTPLALSVHVNVYVPDRLPSGTIYEYCVEPSSPAIAFANRRRRT